jgi:hypothetical protein
MHLVILLGETHDVPKAGLWGFSPDVETAQ